MEREVPVHWLRQNAREWSPPACLFIDVETDEAKDGDTLVLKTVWWSALEVERRSRRKHLRERRWHDGTTPAQLAATVSDVAKTYRTLWVWAHNLSFDATVTSLPLRLCELGWEMTEFSVRGTAPWFRLRNGDHGLVLTDSYSWLPDALERIGQAVGIDKAPLPEVRDATDETVQRCRTDVEITAKAVLDLMGWWDRCHLGNWSLSGAACGWNAYRHRSRRKDILVDPDPEARAFERRAIYGGRRDVWRVGGPWEGRWAEWDLRNAYPTVALTTPLPRKRGRRWDNMDNAHAWTLPTRFGFLAEATITTDTPGIPVRIGKEVWYPTGTFRTVLAGPELAHYRSTGQATDIGPGYDYDVSPEMADWAEWVLAIANGNDTDAPQVARIAAKHWSRAVIGKWAAHTHQRTEIGRALEPGWHVEEASVADHLGPAALVDMAGKRYEVRGDIEPDNSFPAVTAWVESVVRLALNRAIAAYGYGRVLTCNTDGFLADAAHISPGYVDAPPTPTRPLPRTGTTEAFMADLATASAPFTLARRADWSTITVVGPQHVEKDRVRAYSGVPARAVEVDPGRFTVHTWPKLTWQMTNGHRDAYLRPERTSVIAGPYARRWVLADGSTIPAEVRISAGGATELVPWVETAAGSLGLPLAPAQHKRLAGIVDVE